MVPVGIHMLEGSPPGLGEATWRDQGSWPHVAELPDDRQSHLGKTGIITVDHPPPTCSKYELSLHTLPKLQICEQKMDSGCLNHQVLGCFSKQQFITGRFQLKGNLFLGLDSCDKAHVIVLLSLGICQGPGNLG